MKLCLVILTVAVATCHALPVPQETVFAVYPVNSALAQHSTDQPFNTQPEQDAGTTPALSSPVVESKLPADQPKVLESEESKPTAAAVPATEQGAKVDAPSVAAKLASLLEPTTEVKAVEPTTTASLEATKDEATTTEVAKTVPPTVPPQTPVAETKPDATNATVKDGNEPKVLAADPMANVEKKVPNVSAEQTAGGDAGAEKAPAASEDSPKLLEPSKAEVKSEVSKAESAKPAEEPKKAEVVEANQARSAASEEPAATTEAKPQSELADDVKSAEPALKPAPVVEEQPAAEVPTKTDLKDVKPTSSSTVPEPKTEGAQVDKPTKVRAAPIVEGLKVSQPVEAEPAVAKIHVTVIQEELPAEKQLVPSVPAQSVPVAVNEVTPVAAVKAAQQVEKSSAEAAKETPVTSTAEPKPTAVSETPNTETKSDATEKSAAVENKSEPSESPVTAAVTETAATTTKVVPELEPIVVVSSVTSETSAEATTVVVSSSKDNESVQTTKPEEKPATEAAPTVRSAPPDELPAAEKPLTVEDEPKEVKTDDQPLAKAADGSSQPGSAKVTESTSANSADQGDSDSTTTVTSVTEAELAPTPARLKGKKQIPPNLRGYSKRLKQQEARKQLVDFE